MSLSLAAVFTHQSPQVAWPNRTTFKGRCELSDVLIAVIDRRTSQSKGYAILVQAKQVTGRLVNLSAKEQVQYDLYSQRPKFDVRSTSGPSQLDLSNQAPDRALMYGLVLKGHLFPYPFYPWTWLAASDLASKPANYTVQANVDLPRALVALLEGHFGWPFDLSSSGANWRHFDSQCPRRDWTTLINYLLEETFAKQLTKRLASAAGRPIRGQDVPMFYSRHSSAGLQFVTALGAVSSIAFGGVDGDAPDAEKADEWQATDLATALGDGGGFGGGDDDDGGFRDEGPLSVVIFEIGKKE